MGELLGETALHIMLRIIDWIDPSYPLTRLDIHERWRAERAKKKRPKKFRWRP